MIGSKSKLILVGVPHHKKKISINTLDINLGKKIIGSKGGNIKPYKDINIIFKLFKKKKLIFLNFMIKYLKLMISIKLLNS